MKISVVISTYNGERYVIEQLKSIREQSREPDEVLIFDDCSTDHTVQVIEEFIQHNSLKNWKLYVNIKNKGWKKNFMDGLWIACGDLLFPCDQDDIWYPNKIKVMEEIMEKNQNIQVLTSNYDAFYSSGKLEVGPVKNDGKIIPQVLKSDIFTTPYPGCTYCIRKEIVEISKKYWEDGFPHDALFWRLGIISGTLFTYQKSLIKWRKHDDSAYSIESVNSKNYLDKREWLTYADRVIDNLKMFEKEQKTHITNYSKVLEKSKRWNQIRIEFYDSRNLIYWLLLIKYIRCYSRFRQYLGDFYLVYVKRGD